MVGVKIGTLFIIGHNNMRPNTPYYLHQSGCGFLFVSLACTWSCIDGKKREFEFKDQRTYTVTMSKDGKTPPYTRSVIDFEAPSDSPHAWLNHAIFLGTLSMPREMPRDKPYVIISVYKVQ